MSKSFNRKLWLGENFTHAKGQNRDVSKNKRMKMNEDFSLSVKTNEKDIFSMKIWLLLWKLAWHDEKKMGKKTWPAFSYETFYSLSRDGEI